MKAFGAGVALGLALFCFAAPVAHADTSWSREEALTRLASASTAERRLAVLRLASIGEQRDTRALAAHLHDDDPVVAALAESALWQVWSRSGDPDVDRLFEQGVNQMNAGELDAAIGTFTEIVRAKPEFAEGWNKRATAYFLAGDLDRSMEDCDEVLRRNPLHFGALAGYGQIWFRKNRYEKALEFWRRALEVNPTMEGVRANVEGLTRLLEQRRRQQVRAHSLPAV